MRSPHALARKAEFLADVALSRQAGGWNGNVIAQQEPNWYIDFLLGNDANSGTSPSSPVQTIMGGVVPKWGTNEPTFIKSDALSSVLLNVSSAPPGGEDVWLEPTKFGGVNFGIIGTLGAVTTTTITTITTKSYATNTRYAITVPGPALALLSIGMLLTNTSRANSWAVITNIVGATVKISQPFAAAPFTGTILFDPVYDDSWAPGDTLSIGTQLPMNLNLHVKGGNGLTGYAGGITWIQNIGYTTSSGQAFYSYIVLDGANDFLTNYVACSFACVTQANDKSYFVGCFAPPNALFFASGQFVVLLGGYYGFASFKGTDNYADSDCIIGGGESFGTLVVFGRTWLDGHVVVGGWLYLNAFNLDVKICGAAGAIDVEGGGTVMLDQIAGETWEQAVFIPTLSIDGSASGTARGGSFGAVTITPANLDAAPGRTLSNPDTSSRFTSGGL